VGDFGPVTIKQSVTIDGNNLGSITFTGYAAISISGVTNVTVQNLTINGLGSGGYGIDADNQGFVTVHNCEVMSFIGDGIVFGGSGALTVENSRILSFAGSSGVGIYMTGSGNVVVKNTFIDASPLGLNRDGFAVWDGAGSVKASLQNVTIMGAGGAAVSAGAGFTEITDSILTQSAYGVFIFDNRGTISVANSLITANQTGLCIGALSTIRLDNNDIFDNPTAIANCGGSVNTGGNNKISGNIAISDSVVSDTVTF
jgi:hypothetical protein